MALSTNRIARAIRMMTVMSWCSLRWPGRPPRCRHRRAVTCYGPSGPPIRDSRRTASAGCHESRSPLGPLPERWDRPRRREQAMKRRGTAGGIGRSRPGRAARTRRTVRLLVTVALAVGLSPALAPTPVFAHGATRSIAPADGAALPDAPRQVAVVFAAEISQVGAVTITDRAGRDWAGGRPAVQGATLTQQVATGMPDGGYRISWRATFTDGHPVAGTSEFTVGAQAAAAVAANPFRARVTSGGLVALQAAAGAAVLALLLAIIALARGVYPTGERADSTR
ncbi:copper resistance protein CopC [Micromonospora musae]|uniref:Copper resistance protein CopC n=2 Tax=Micromonospora musae TaxID=1894970 RepID=A0ABX9RF38_9ACTN|nr:copper resistance protein CopC [Micromonospora musae]